MSINDKLLFSIFLLATGILVYVVSESHLSLLLPGVLHRDTDMFNVMGFSVLSHYEGIVDALAHISYGIPICRTINIYKAINFCREHNITSFYILLDSKHVRSFVYYNNTLYMFDLADPSYVFNPKDSIIIFCNLDIEKSGNITDILPNCNIIFYKGEYIPYFKHLISKILLYNYTWEKKR